MPDVTAGLDSLQISVLTKASTVSKSVRNITIGPNSSPTLDDTFNDDSLNRFEVNSSSTPIKNHSRSFHSNSLNNDISSPITSSPKNVEIASLDESSRSLMKLINELDQRRQSLVREALKERIMKMEKESRMCWLELQSRHQYQQRENLAKLQQEENMILQQQQEEEIRACQREQQYAQKCKQHAQRINELSEMMKEAEKRQKEAEEEERERLKEKKMLIEEIHQCQIDFRKRYEKVVELAKQCTDRQAFIARASTTTSQLKGLSEGMEQLVKHCKNGETWMNLWIKTRFRSTSPCKNIYKILKILMKHLEKMTAHLQDKLMKLSRLISGQPVEVGNSRVSAASHPQGVAFCKNLMAKKFVWQGELTVSSKPEAAFAIAAVIEALWADFPDFGELVLAHFYKECPYLVPLFMPQIEGQSNEDYYRALGYHYNENGEVEKQDKFLKRMSGIMRLYAAILITRPCRYQQNKSNPHGLSYAWRWISCLLNLDPRPDICATLLYEFLVVAGNSMYAYYGKQFQKLLHLICKEYYPKIEKVTPSVSSGPMIRLEAFLQKILKQNHIPPPVVVTINAMIYIIMLYYKNKLYCTELSYSKKWSKKSQVCIRTIFYEEKGKIGHSLTNLIFAYKVDKSVNFNSGMIYFKLVPFYKLINN
ncbi:hypothetical protein C0J52_04659 [Blattella germanica]|nr:hypothetical protein C0J52_04659 [Blattella germanica]